MKHVGYKSIQHACLLMELKKTIVFHFIIPSSLERTTNSNTTRAASTTKTTIKATKITLRTTPTIRTNAGNYLSKIFSIIIE